MRKADEAPGNERPWTHGAPGWRPTARELLLDADQLFWSLGPHRRVKYVVAPKRGHHTAHALRSRAMTLAREALGPAHGLPRALTHDVRCDRDLRVPMDDGA